MTHSRIHPLQSAITIVVLVLGTGTTVAAETPTEKPTLKDFLVDPTAGTVSAAGIIGLNKSAVQQVESSRDLVMAVQPIANGDIGAGLGFAVTPARAFGYMNAYQYRLGGSLYRLAGNATLSVAQNNRDISNTKYKQTSYSFDTFFYLDPAKDPVIAAHNAYDTCNSIELKKSQQAVAELEDRRVADPPISKEEYDAKKAALAKSLSEAYGACLKSSAKELQKTAWNDTRISISLGAGTIQAPSGGNSYSLGKMLTINGVFRLSDNSALLISLRTVRDAVDNASLTSTPAFKKDSLVAVRYTIGSALKDDDPYPLRALIEVSNVKSSSPAVFKDTFLQAVGLDYRVMKGLWLELRYGRNRTLIGDKKETSGIMTLNFSPSMLLPK